MGGLLCIHPNLPPVQVQDCHAHIVELAQVLGLAFDLICHAPPAGPIQIIQAATHMCATMMFLA